MTSENPVFTLYFKVLFMTDQSQHLESIRDIRQLMQKSSRFISLSGLSGVAAGLCALAASWIAHQKLTDYRTARDIDAGAEWGRYSFREGYPALVRELLILAALTFVVAFVLAFFFTWLRSRKTGVPIWGYVARKVMVHVMVPMAAGGLLILRLMELGGWGFIAPVCLIFYGLALINASKFTFPEIRYLGYGQLLLGLVNLWMMGHGLGFWALGFGVLHIVYGFIMWWQHERGTADGGSA